MRYEIEIKMAASNVRARRLTKDLMGDCERREKRPVGRVIQKRRGQERKEIIHNIDGRTAEGVEKKSGDGIGTKIASKIGGQLEEVVDGVVGEGVDYVSDEGTDGRSGDGKVSLVKEGEPGLGETRDEAIRCLCTREVESGEMVCCEICEGWSHIRCLGMKEDAGVMEGKSFVCYFCLSACLVQLRKEVGGLREEMSMMKSEMDEMRVENERLRGLGLGGSQREEVLECMTQSEGVTGDKVEKMVVSDEREKQATCLQRSGQESSERQNDCGGNSPKSVGREKSAKYVSGVRKVWGTRKREFCNEIAKEMVRVVGKMSSRFFISKHVGQWKEKKVWWFVVKAQERDLLTLDEQWKHKYWRWQKVGRGERDFLAMEPVSEGHR